MNVVKRYFWFFMLFISFGLFCTIQDDNGNPAVSGPNTPDIIIVTPETAPLLLASADSTYIKQGDTLAILTRIFSDTTGGDSLRPLAGARITAKASRGRLVKDTLISDSDGRARFLITDTTIGRIEVTLQSHGTEQIFRFEITNTPDRIQKLIEILPTRSVIKADNQDTTLITVSIINELHNPIANEKIQFITTSGVITGDLSNPNNSGQSKTNNNGIARATLRSTNINDTAYITAYLVSDQTLCDETEVVFRGMTITVKSNVSNLLTNDTALITARLMNASGNPVSKNPIFTSLNNGTNSNLRIIYADSVTNYDGFAFYKVRALRNGMDNLVFTSSGTQASLQLNVSSLSLQLSLNKSVLQTNASDSSVLLVTFTNNNGAPLKGRTVTITRTYKTEAGSDTTDVFKLLCDANGRAYHTIKTLNYEGIMRIEAIGFDPSEGYASANTMIQFLTTRVMTIRGPESIPADGESKKEVTVVIKNKTGNPIIGDVINFTTTAGVITYKTTTDENGKAIAYLTSDRRNTEALITATLESDPTKTQSIAIDFTGVKIDVTANPPSISSDGNDTSHVFISLLDAAGKAISGEHVSFYTQQLATKVVQLDSVTDNTGEARCKIFGTGSGKDTIRISAAGASNSIVLNYSSNRLIINTAAGQTCIADSSDSTLFLVTYLLGDNTTRIPNARLDISATVGNLGTVFASQFVTNSNGQVSFYLNNPHFATTTTISVLAYTSTELTSQTHKVYFRANNVSRIVLSGTPEVIAVNTGRAKITAIAFDSLGNRVNNTRLSFNIVNGPSGGEFLDPPTSLTGDDGSATTYLIAGKTPSTHRQVWITAGNFSSIKSDTVKFTIAGPPIYITIGSNILKGKNPNDGTFILPCAAIVTDINGNPVVDGTDVTFSLKISGYVTRRLIAKWYNETGTTISCYPVIDTSAFVLPFEDFNDNFVLDPGEDRNNDGILNRGEDINGDGLYLRGPSFQDINGDGKRQYNLYQPVEERHRCTNGSVQYVDFNNNGVWDPIEPLNNSNYLMAYYRLRSDSAFERFPSIRDAKDSSDFAILAYYDSLYENGPGYIAQLGSYDIDYAGNGIADPNTAVSIKRTIQTKDGKALNEIIYGQSDALQIEVMIWAESQGVVTKTPEQIVLPIISDKE